MVKMLVFVSFPNSTIRLRNSVYSSQTAQTVFRQSLKRLYYLMLHMEVPYESKLFVLSGLDINLALFLWVFLLFFNHFDQTFGGWFWGCLDSLDRVGPCQHHITAELKLLLV